MWKRDSGSVLYCTAWWREYLHAGVDERVADGEQRRDGAVGGGAVQARRRVGSRADPHAGGAAEAFAHPEVLHR